MLGGSSGINFTAYIMPAAEDIDLWEMMGNKGWSWNELKPYYLKHRSSQGGSGPIITSCPSEKSLVEDRIIAALDEMTGSLRAQDPYNGKPLGLYEHLSTVDPKTGNRSYAASAFLHPHGDRNNLHVLTNATVCKVIYDQDSSTASGVEFLFQGVLHRISAKFEIILAAGAIQTPQILELSGIGDPKVLRRAGINCTIPLPDVGNNLCEHPMTSLTYMLDSKTPSTGSGVSMITFLPYSSLVAEEELEKTVAQVEQVISLSKAERQAIVSRLRNPASGAVQLNGFSACVDIESGLRDRSKLMPDVSGHEHSYWSFLVTTSTLSRGSTHAVSSDPLTAPSIDLGLLKQETDVDLLAAGLEFADRVFSSNHVSDQVVKRVVPSSNLDLNDREKGREFVRNWATSFNHILGTCAMGKVVDQRLRVKGVRGLRIVDASVIPTQISGNILATVYAVAEKAADLIKEDYQSFRASL